MSKTALVVGTYAVGSRVIATRQITEGGVPGDPCARFPEPAYIHAEANDNGTIETIDGDCACPTVRFDRTRTATIVGPSEVTLARQQNEIINGNATAAGMNRLLDGENVKDTVKHGSEKV